MNPFVKKEKYHFPLNVNLSDEQGKMLLRIKEETKMTRSEIIRLAVEDIYAKYLETLEEDKV